VSGVKLSHENLVQGCYLAALPGRAWAAQQDASKPSRVLAHLPISHIAGLYGYCIAPLYNGGTVYWLPKYTWSQLLLYVPQHQITTLYTVPSIYLRICKSPEVKDQFKSVEFASTGAAPMSSDLQTAASSCLGTGETVIGQTWGLSETTGAVTMVPRGQKAIPGSIGYILQNVELR
jgi:4-coumarate--CoA ligase